MIPLHLRIAGFLSYQDPVELDFTCFDLACISGPNGAGKSSLLDAMTWALFGQARRRDDALVNLQSQVAEVAFTFRYEQADYRVLRALARGKTASLEFQIKGTSSSGEDSAWKPLTERTMKETQARVEHILRLDYDTFVNASFFLQGKADQFAQQSPARRKEVLTNILGMETWEELKVRTAESRKNSESDLASVEGRLAEIGTELSEEQPRRQRLAELEAELARLAAARKAQSKILESLRQTRASLEKQRLLLDEQAAALERTLTEIAALRDRLADREAARLASADLSGRAVDIEAAFGAWKRSLDELQRWEGVARLFRDRQSLRLPFLQELATEKARLEEERHQLTLQQAQAVERESAIAATQAELDQASVLLAEVDAKMAERDRLLAKRVDARETIATRTAENQSLKEKMDALKERIQTLRSATGAACPLCGQPLTDSHRRSMLDGLQQEGTQHGDSYRLNRASVEELRANLAALESHLSELDGVEDEKLANSRSVAQLGERLDSLRAQIHAWESTGRERLDTVSKDLQAEQYALQARVKLTKVDAELAELGYDAAEHDRVRERELSQRTVEQEYSQLQTARAALAPLENEIQNIRSQLEQRAPAIARQESALQNSTAALEATEADLLDAGETERTLFALQEQENVLNQQVGAARQRVAILDDLRLRTYELDSSRQSLASSIGRYKMLERAFGRDGVPALLIEQSLPELESRANEILDRLSDGRMSVHFVTQAGYRDKKRQDLRETLDIQISDGAGSREYEMYSGGEAFRVNFAIRLALSQVLAGRKGARLQTLIIDEGFGSQDGQGRQRLIETINLVRHDFAKILLITHLEELKDAFPTRIEVIKTERGSSLTVN